MGRSTITEENYLKSIYKHSEKETPVATNTLAADLQTTPASVTDMIKKLNEKQLVEYSPYHGVTLTDEGNQRALQIVRKHRLWEVFLKQKLNYTWDQVHETAEHLEHVHSDALFTRLEKYLNHPKFDPHGEPIPDAGGKMEHPKYVCLSELPVGATLIVQEVEASSPEFLKLMSRMGIALGKEVTVIEYFDYEKSRLISINDETWFLVGNMVSNIRGHLK